MPECRCPKQNRKAPRAAHAGEAFTQAGAGCVMCSCATEMGLNARVSEACAHAYACGRRLM